MKFRPRSCSAPIRCVHLCLGLLSCISPLMDPQETLAVLACAWRVAKPFDYPVAWTAGAVRQFLRTMPSNCPKTRPRNSLFIGAVTEQNEVKQSSKLFFASSSS
jgi:hypothetical protein